MGKVVDPEVEGKQAAAEADSRSIPQGEARGSSWQRVDLANAMNGEFQRIRPSILERSDGRRLFYAGRINGLHGSDAAGKTFVAYVAAAQELEAGNHVLWIDLEEPSEEVAVERLCDVLSVDSDLVIKRFHYYRPVDEFSDAALGVLLRDIEHHGITLVVLDSLGEAFSLEGVDEDRDVQVGPWLRRFVRPLADAGPAVVLIDHTAHSGDKLRPAGSKRKRAAISGASYLAEGKPPPTRQRPGKVILTCGKDRHGHYQRKQEVAEFVFDRHPERGTIVTVTTPSSEEKRPASDAEQVAELAQVAALACRDAGEPLSQRGLEMAMGRGRTQAKRDAIRVAVDAGWISRETGKGGAQLHTFVKEPEAG